MLSNCIQQHRLADLSSCPRARSCAGWLWTVWCAWRRNAPSRVTSRATPRSAVVRTDCPLKVRRARCDWLAHFLLPWVRALLLHGVAVTRSACATSRVPPCLLPIGTGPQPDLPGDPAARLQRAPPGLHPALRCGFVPRLHGFAPAPLLGRVSAPCAWRAERDVVVASSNRSGPLLSPWS